MPKPTSPKVHACLGLRRAAEARKQASLEQHELQTQPFSIPGSTLGCRPAISPVPTTGLRLALHSSLRAISGTCCPSRSIGLFVGMVFRSHAWGSHCAPGLAVLISRPFSGESWGHYSFLGHEFTPTALAPCALPHLPSR